MASSSSNKNKRKREDAQDDYSGGIEAEISGFMHGSKKRHTIDSDSEEENPEDYNKKKHSVLKDEDIEGQEEEAEDVDYDGDGEVKITPFNMKGEMEEGYFDGQGTYIWNKKDASEIKDSWLDSVDWMKLKKVTAKDKEARPPPDTDSDSSLDYMQLADKSFTTPFYKECLSYMKPGENILKAIKRHGGGSKTLSASERLKQKKLAKLQGEGGTGSTTEAGGSGDSSNQEAVNKLTEIANKFISLGDMDIYQETFESLTHKVDSFDKVSTNPPPPPKPAVAPLDGLDMFSN